MGLARGKTFNQSTLDEVERFLTDQYYSRGKYGVRVATKVEEPPDNRVKIAIDIAEGKRSKIRQINIVGNEAFASCSPRARPMWQPSTPSSVSLRRRHSKTWRPDGGDPASSKSWRTP